jgi:hypothetical protein
MITQWRKSSYSQGQGGTDCVEVASMANTAVIRDSKDPAGPHLIFARGRLRDLISDVKAGRYDTAL